MTEPQEKGPSRAEVKQAAAAKAERTESARKVARKTTTGKATSKVRVRYLVNSVQHRRGDKVSVDAEAAERMVTNRLATYL